MLKKINFYTLNYFLAFVIIAAAVATTRTAANLETRISADPSIVAVINPITRDSNFKFSNCTVGTKFLANVTITDVAWLAGWQINITYNPTLLNISNSADLFLPSNHIFNGLDPRAAAKAINITVGYAMWACAIGPSSPRDHFNGSGTICQILFTIIKTPGEGETLSCNFVLDRISTFPTNIIDPDANDIPFTEQNGYYEISAGLIHDVAVIGVEPFMTVVGQGYVSINLIAENQGNYAEVFNVTAYCNSTPIATMIGISLPSDANIIIMFTWNTTGFAKGNYSVWAYAWPVLGEKDKTDNTYTDGWVVVTILGDINGDLKVDIKDLVLVIKHYASYPNHPKWNPNADVNGDNKVDVKDLVLVIKHYGEQDP